VSAGGWRLRWFFNRRVALALLWTVVVLSTAIIANLVGIRLTGGIADWQQWMDAHAAYFLVWRLLLYAGTAWGWIWMRQRLVRVEIAAVLAVTALEVSQLLWAG